MLATTRTYLLIIPTLCDNGKTGFDHAMGKEKPVPSKLQISAKDCNKYGITTINFKPARFNNFTSSGEETRIVTSTGLFLVTWNFRKVKKGVLNQYKIVVLNSTPVDNQYQVNHSERVLVTDDKQVGIQTVKRRAIIKY